MGINWAHSARIRHVAPPPLTCVLQRVVNTVRFLNFAVADFRGAWTGREVAHHLAYPPRGRGVSAVPRPAPLTKQGVPQDPRQDLASVWVESGQERDGTACGVCGPNDFKIPETTGP